MYWIATLMLRRRPFRDRLLGFELDEVRRTHLHVVALGLRNLVGRGMRRLNASSATGTRPG